MSRPAGAASRVPAFLRCLLLAVACAEPGGALGSEPIAEDRGTGEAGGDAGVAPASDRLFGQDALDGVVPHRPLDGGQPRIGGMLVLAQHDNEPMHGFGWYELRPRLVEGDLCVPSAELWPTASTSLPGALRVSVDGEPLERADWADGSVFDAVFATFSGDHDPEEGDHVALQDGDPAVPLSLPGPMRDARLGASSGGASPLTWTPAEEDSDLIIAELLPGDTTCLLRDDGFAMLAVPEGDGPLALTIARARLARAIVDGREVEVLVERFSGAEVAGRSGG